MHRNVLLLSVCKKIFPVALLNVDTTHCIGVTVDFISLPLEAKKGLGIALCIILTVCYTTFHEKYYISLCNYMCVYGTIILWLYPCRLELTVRTHS